jgi:hypothetical protein
MFRRNTTALVLCAALFGAAPAIDLLGGSVATAAPSPDQVVAASVASALAALKNSLAYQNASSTPGQQALMLAQAVRDVVASALENGVSAQTIADGLNDAVAAGTVTGAIAVQGAALAAVEVAQAGGVGAAQASNLVNLVQAETNVQASLAASGGSVVVTSTNAQGQSVTALVSLSTMLAAAAGGTLTANGQLSGITTAPGSGFSPCRGVVADYC